MSMRTFSRDSSEPSFNERMRDHLFLFMGLNSEYMTLNGTFHQTQMPDDASVRESLQKDIQEGRAVIVLMDVQSNVNGEKDRFEPELVRGVKDLLHKTAGKIPVIHVGIGFQGAQNIYTPAYLNRYGVDYVLEDNIRGPARPFLYPVSADDYMVVKGDWSLFMGSFQQDIKGTTGFRDFLEENGWKTVIYVGRFGERCILTNAIQGDMQGVNSAFLSGHIYNAVHPPFLCAKDQHLYYQKAFAGLGPVVSNEEFHSILQTVPQQGHGRRMPAALLEARR